MGQQSSTYPVIVKLLNPTDEIRPGMAANVSFDFESKTDEDIIIVPYVAVAEDQGGNYIFVVEETMSDTAIVHKRSIKCGNLIEENFEILEGLDEGELVVTAGISKLTDGMKVKLLKK